MSLQFLKMVWIYFQIIQRLIGDILPHGLCGKRRQIKLLIVNCESKARDIGWKKLSKVRADDIRI